MRPFLELARLAQADREREIRGHAPHDAALAAGRRHPAPPHMHPPDEPWALMLTRRAAGTGTELSG
jgi:hypothetical protein